MKLQSSLRISNESTIRQLQEIRMALGSQSSSPTSQEHEVVQAVPPSMLASGIELEAQISTLSELCNRLSKRENNISSEYTLSENTCQLIVNSLQKNLLSVETKERFELSIADFIRYVDRLSIAPSAIESTKTTELSPEKGDRNESDLAAESDSAMETKTKSRSNSLIDIEVVKPTGAMAMKSLRTLMQNKLHGRYI